MRTNTPLYFRTHDGWHRLDYTDQWVLTRLRLPNPEKLKGRELDEHYMQHGRRPEVWEDMVHTRKYFPRLEPALEYLSDYVMGCTWSDPAKDELAQLRTRVQAAADMLQSAIFRAEKETAQ